MHSRFAFLLAGVASVATLVLARDARADGPSPSHSFEFAPSNAAVPRSAEAGPVVETQWYGWQTLLVDAPAFGALVLSSTRHSDALGVVGVGGYALLPPLVHVAHGRPGTALADFGLRLVTPVLFGVIGYGIDVAMNRCPPVDPNQGLSGPWCFPGLAGAAYGLLAGYATAVVLDAAWLAHEPVLMKKSDARDAAHVRWTPTVAITPTGGSAGVSGAF